MDKDDLKKQDDIVMCTTVGIVTVCVAIPFVFCWVLWVIIRLFYQLGCSVLDVPIDESMKFHDEYTTSDWISDRLDMDYKTSLYYEHPFRLEPRKELDKKED